MIAGASNRPFVELPSAVIEKSPGAPDRPPPTLNGNCPGDTTVELPAQSISVKQPFVSNLMEQGGVSISAASLYRAR